MKKAVERGIRETAWWIFWHNEEVIYANHQGILYQNKIPAVGDLIHVESEGRDLPIVSVDTDKFNVFVQRPPRS